MTYKELIKEILDKVNNLEQEIDFSVNVCAETESYFVNAGEINVLSCGMYVKIDLKSNQK